MLAAPAPSFTPRGRPSRRESSGPGPGGAGAVLRGRAGRRRSWPLLHVLLTLSFAPACDAPDAAPASAPASVPASAPPDAPASAPPADVERKVLAWLDPDAPALAYLRVPPELDLEALGELFALPPRALALLRAPVAFDAGLAALTGPDLPRAALAPDAAVMHPPLARGPYLVRRLLLPRAEIEARLRAGGLRSDVVEGFAVWSPGGDVEDANTAAGLPTTLSPAAVFPYRLVFLADDLLGAFSLAEIGSGLGPLTAARDLPPSELSRTVTEVVARDPDLLLEIYVQGMMLHFDLSDDLGVAKLSLRRGPGDGLDGEVLLQPLGDVPAAVAILDARAPAGATTDVLRELYARVAYSADGPVVRGRLQLAAEDLRPFRREAAP